MDFELARTNMVKSQVIPNGITDDLLLKSLQATAREPFIVAPHTDFAYSDLAIPLADGERRYLKPLQLAQMIQSLELKPESSVLVVGAGSGYEAALLADMGMKVSALETDAALVEQGKTLCPEGVSWKNGKLTEGWEEVGPFDGILVCGVVPSTPTKLVGQLASEGRLAVIIGHPGDAIMRGICIVGRSGSDRPETLFETVGFPLPDFRPPARFEL